MSDVILKSENISKQYRLGLVGTGTLSHDLNRWWHRLRGKQDPYLQVGEMNDRTQSGKNEYIWALKDISFEVNRGEVLGIIGKNGAGKSTLLKILSKVTSPTTGIIRSGGRIASLLEVGTGFHPELTGRENIYLNGAILGMTKTEISSKLEEIIEFSGCQRYIDTPVKRYSSGMKVRLAFAVAAHLEPDILVVDEVLAVGDVEFQKKAIGKMQDISKGNGRTVLFVSHNMAAVQSLCNRVIVLNNGSVIFNGNVKQGIDQYLSSSIQNIDIDLIKRTDRVGTGHALITGFSLLTANPTTGQDLKLRFQYQNNSDDEISEFGFSIWKIDGTKLISISSSFKEDIIFENNNETSIECSIYELPLVKGSYLLNAFISTKAGISDYIESLSKIVVEDSDYYGTGRTVNPEWGSIVVNHSWSNTIK